MDGGTLGTEHRAPENGGTVGSGYDISGISGTGEIAGDAASRGGTLGSGHVVPGNATDDGTARTKGVNGMGGG